ncbi:5-bromo-4-chloroindolyl phosphate hydrolysis family protein [Methylohalobius crimeensis]|uniref:5-bromo-4-chloroindolyl phosphate hydrolysis family protein n=1 Tax=Methylohalobius crimeensis TaxID=244365 RepID=UPI0003B467DA|nr:5-bromo-4-chloroindolyl phosphate hydrolysis family protein [Methylohalobius crimeensis]
MNQLPDFSGFKLPRFGISKRSVADTLQRYSPRGLLLYFLPVALIPATVIALAKGDVTAVIVNASGFAGYMLAAWCVRRGLKAEALYDRRRIARPPRWPLKLTAALIAATATGMIVWLGAGRPPLVASLFAGGALLGMYLSYGFDPRRPKQIVGAHGYSGDEILQTLEESGRIIRNIEQANDRIRNPELNRRIERICTVADDILAEIEADPRDIRRARKFLTVYLDGARQVTEGYARTHEHTQSGELEQNFRNVLISIESVFREQKQKLLEDDVFDLDVQIEVLNTQLKREGIL